MRRILLGLWMACCLTGLAWAEGGTTFPFPSYSSDTGLAGGLKQFQSDVLATGNRFESLLFLSLNQQLVAEFILGQDPPLGTFFRSEFESKNYAYYYYGLGNQNSVTTRGRYQLLQFLLAHEFGERRPDGLRRSLAIEALYIPVMGHDSSALFSSALPGISGGLGVGLGVQVAMDRRDRVENPLEGEYVGVSGKLVLGSFDYVQFGFDYRRYLPLRSDLQAAFRGYLETQAGTVPFYQWLALGGDRRLRGYTEGRFKDVAALGFGIELRQDLPFVNAEWGFAYPVQAAYFVDAGRVAADVMKLTFAGYHASQGLGLRILVRPDAVVRIDWGFGEDEQAIYFTFGQAV